MKSYVERHQRALAESIDPADPRSGGEALGRRHAHVVDGLLRSLFAAARASTSWKAPVALAAVGSYGRGAVALKSDLDVRFLVPGKKDDAAPLAEAMLYPLWDGGVTVGHQIVTIDEVLDLARTDLPTATSILDWRHLGGEPRLSEELVVRARAQVFGDAGIAAFVQRLTDEVAGRHERFGGSVYLLEPDVKSGAGGLRDLDVAGWTASARWNVTELSDLVRLGVVLQREAARIAEARELLWRIRNRLHQAAGRRADRLTFEQQERLCEELGYGEGGAAVEAFMSDYYRNARAVTAVREILMSRAKPRELGRRKPHEEDVGGGIRSFDGQLTLAEDDLAKEPALAFRLYSEAATRNQPIFGYARDAVVRATQDAAFCEKLRASPDAQRRFLDLVASAHEAPRLSRRSVLAEMHDVGLVVAMLPEFSPVIGRVHHDVYHVYTVDVHSVAAVDRLHALVRGDLASEHPLACRLAAETTRPIVLSLATLLHDVGKAIGGKDHANRGAEMAKGIGARLGLDAKDTNEIVHLVRAHLAMYHVATRRDLDDPSTVEDFVHENITSRENLRELYLLTVADLSTTSPTAMTAWKAKLLDELYLAADKFLSGRPNTNADDVRAEIIKNQTLLKAGSTDHARSFLETMPERYLLSNEPEAIAAHIGVAARATADKPAVALRAAPKADAFELCVVAPDRPGLLAMIAAAIVASRLEVHAAQIHSHDAGGRVEAVDLFWVRGPGAEERQAPHTLKSLERDLEAMLRGETTPKDVASKRGTSQWASRPTPEVKTEVTVDDRASATHGILEIFTKDRPGVLFALASALHELGLSIALAKINTEGTRVADVFYVSDDEGRKVQLFPRIEAIRAKIVSALAELATGGRG